MNIIRERLAHKYAIAFLNVFGKKITDTQAQHFNEASVFLKNNHKVVFVLGVSTVSKEKKDRLIDTLFRECGLPEVTKKLIPLLYEKKRIGLLPEIFRHIWWLYLKQHNLMHVDVGSSMPLSDDQKKGVEHFLTHKITDKRCVCSFSVDKKLIAGIRLQSDTILWDGSLQSRFKNLDQLLAT